jgi:hypothetical protein
VATPSGSVRWARESVAMERRGDKRAPSSGQPPGHQRACVRCRRERLGKWAHTGESEASWQGEGKGEWAEWSFWLSQVSHFLFPFPF